MAMKSKRIKELPGFDRPREKLMAKGPEALSDAELLAILLGSGGRGRSALELASLILKRFGPRLDQLQVEELKSFEGVGLAKACQVVAAFELARRYLLKEPCDAVAMGGIMALAGRVALVMLLTA